MKIEELEKLWETGQRRAAIVDNKESVEQLIQVLSAIGYTVVNRDTTKNVFTDDDCNKVEKKEGTELCCNDDRLYTSIFVAYDHYENPMNSVNIICIPKYDSYVEKYEVMSMLSYDRVYEIVYELDKARTYTKDESAQRLRKIGFTDSPNFNSNIYFYGTSQFYDNTFMYAQVYSSSDVIELSELFSDGDSSASRRKRYNANNRMMKRSELGMDMIERIVKYWDKRCKIEAILG